MGSVEYAIDSRQPAEALATLQDERLGPDVLAFAHFIGGRLTGPVAPMGFVNDVAFGLSDLQTGHDGEGQLLTGDLVGREPEVYSGLMASVPELARRAFPSNFALEVSTLMVEAGLLPAPEASEKSTLDLGEIIDEPIITIDDAVTRVIEDARDRLVGLDWSKFDDVSSEINIQLFEAVYPIILRNAPFQLSLTTLDGSKEDELDLLAGLQPDRRIHTGEGYWVVLLNDGLAAHEAMIARDHLFLKGIEMVARIQELDPGAVMLHFAADTDGPVGRAARRLRVAIDDYPELMRQPSQD